MAIWKSSSGFLVGAVLQAVRFFNDEDVLSQTGVHPLNAPIQQLIVSKWLQLHDMPDFDADAFNQALN